MRSVRTKTHKLIVYPEVQRIQLYNMEDDRWEMHDLSADPATLQVQGELMQRLRQQQRQLDDPMDLEDPLHGIWHRLPARTNLRARQQA